MTEGASAHRLLAINAAVRVAAAASGQLFAFVVAERLHLPAGSGSMVVGLLSAGFFVTELLGAPLAGAIADRRGQLRVLRAGPALGALSAALAASVVLWDGALASLVAVLVVARVAEGSSAACTVPPTLTLLARVTAGQPERRMRVMGLFEMSSLVAMIAGFALAGVAWDALGPAAFLLLPPLYGGAWVAVPRRPEPASTPRPWAVIATLRRLAAAPGAAPFAVAWLAVNAVVGVWLQFAPYLLKLPHRSPSQRLVGGFSGSEIGLVFAIWGFTFLAGLAAWSFLGGGLPRRRVLAVSLVGMLGVVGALTLVNHGAPGWLLAVAVVAILLESGFTPAAFAHLADLTEGLDDARGAALGVYSLLLGLGQLVGGVLGAPFAARWQMHGVLTLTAALALVALSAVALMPPDRRRST